ncbi:hypothetical protein SAMN02745130_02463 [Thiothrix eikelboomii]|uniref:Uncharacterized protein n=1 Tax=Thiothrix eikelboomii TaxID=92487 RepID=A0A1T4X312_9GAMM|nr:hypothetical protein [Thiothrix eikelboomii]SKA83946.1 hypothetical protein SAMN02745130_02463 [Thiothrix eikelboomii]
MTAKLQRSPLNKFRFSLLTSILISILPSTASYAGNQDPLSLNEQAQVSALVESALPSLRVKSEADANQLNQHELLLIERDRSEDKKSGVRRANAFVYDYQTDETIIYRIDAATHKILSSVRKKNMQLPLTEAEIKRTVDLIFSDKETLALIANEYQRITHKALNAPNDLQAKAFVFTADTLPEQLNPASQQCGLHRCAQILLYTHDSVVFEVSPIVNLSAKLITQIVGF